MWFSRSFLWFRSRSQVDSLLLLWCLILWSTSLGSQKLSSLDLLFGHFLFSELGIIQLSFEALLSFQESLRLLLLLALDDAQRLLIVRLGLENSVLWKPLLVGLVLGDPFLNYLMFGFLGLFTFLLALDDLAKLLRFLVSLLNNDVDELRSLLDSVFHLDVECCSDLGSLLSHKVWSSFSSSGKPFIGNLSNSLVCLKLSELLSLFQLLLDLLPGDWRSILSFHESLNDLSFSWGERFLEWNLNDDWLTLIFHLKNLKFVF